MTHPSSPPDRLDFDLSVWEVVKQVPPGRVTTYGTVARLLPVPTGVLETTYAAFGARWVGAAMARCPEDVPWHRVVNARGEVSVRAGEGREEQWERLRVEGVVPRENGSIDLRARGWGGSRDAACDEAVRAEATHGDAEAAAEGTDGARGSADAGTSLQERLF